MNSSSEPAEPIDGDEDWDKYLASRVKPRTGIRLRAARAATVVVLLLKWACANEQSEPVAQTNRSS